MAEITMKNKIWKTQMAVLVAAALGLFSNTAFAHHSFAMFDQDKKVTITGTLAEFSWTNPHIWFDLLVPDGKGCAEKWGIEADSPATLTRGGWRYDSIKVGDKMTFVVHPLKSGGVGGSLISCTLPDGTVLGRGRLSGLPEGASTEGRPPAAAPY
jgi:hypothetical protein